MINIKTYTFLCAIILIPVLVSCNRTEKMNDELYPAKMYEDFPYDLSKPDTVFKLSYELVEISGLSNYNDRSLLAVQDENGIVFQIDARTGIIEKKVNFNKNGDYEGIEYVDSLVYILNSNGNLYYFVYPGSGNSVQVDQMKTGLDKKKNVEGLTVSNDGSELYISSKDGSEKNIFTFLKEDLNSVRAISVKEIKNFVSQQNIQTVTKVKFKPSGIAIHPLNGDIYILTHTGKAILTLDNQFKIISFVQLNPYRFPQPEGICFTSDGTMFISNEGNFQNSTLLKFSMR